jgi:hypothetical protein
MGDDDTQNGFNRTRDLINALTHPKWRELLLLQLEADSSQRHWNNRILYNALNSADKTGSLRSDLCPSPHDCELLLVIGMTARFPDRDLWSAPGAAILDWFCRVQDPSFAPVIERNYPAAGIGPRGLALVVLCVQTDAQSFETLLRLIDANGLSPFVASRPFFHHLYRCHVAKARRLLPNLLLKAGTPDNVAGTMNFIKWAMERGHLNANDLEPASDFTHGEATRLLSEIEKRQQISGSAWRFEEEYQEIRNELGVYLELAGIIPDARTDVLQRALQLNDPRPVSQAVVSLLRKREEPSRSSIKFAATSLETRSDFYTQLKQLDRLDLFPPELVNFESFAASEATRWLVYPGELASEPASLELVAKIVGTTHEGTEAVMCLWKGIADDGALFSFESGPYDANAEVGPLDGNMHNVREWNERTLQEHIDDLMQQLGDSHVNWYKSTAGPKP